MLRLLHSWGRHVWRVDRFLLDRLVSGWRVRHAFVECILGDYPQNILVLELRVVRLLNTEHNCSVAIFVLPVHTAAIILRNHQQRAMRVDAADGGVCSEIQHFGERTSTIKDQHQAQVADGNVDGAIFNGQRVGHQAIGRETEFVLWDINFLGDEPGRMLPLETLHRHPGVVDGADAFLARQHNVTERT